MRLRFTSPSRLLAATLLLASLVAAQGVPERRLIGYWHNWGGVANGLPLANVPAEYDVVNIAFATPTVPFGATMSFTPDTGMYPQVASFIAEVQALQAQGRKVLISIGGANDPVQLDTAGDVASFVASMAQIINTYGFDGLDIDLESGSLSLLPGDTDFTSPTSPRIVNFIAAINQLVAMMPASFLLTAAPETALLQGAYSAYGGIWGAYLPVIHALRNQLDWVQTQHYNTGSMFGRDGQIYQPATADFHVAMADMLIGGFTVFGGASFPSLQPEQVAIGLPSSTQAAGSGFTANGVVHDALDRLYLGRPFGGSYALANAAGYSRLRGVMTWSINWDVIAGSSFSAAHRAHLDGLFLDPDAASLSVSTGGTLSFSLRAGVGFAARPYVLVPGASGTSPGLPLPGGLTLPINPDAVSLLALDPLGAPFFSAFVGTLDSLGEATAQVVLPPVPGAPSFPLDFAFVTANPFDFVSPARRVQLVP